MLTTYFNEVLEMGGGPDGQVDVAVQGSAVWNPCHPGWVAVPVKSSQVLFLEHHKKVVDGELRSFGMLVPEQRTTLTCHACGEEQAGGRARYHPPKRPAPGKATDAQWRNWRHNGGKTERMRNVRGLKICSSRARGFRHVNSRDVNAAWNIGRVAMAILLGHPRPAQLVPRRRRRMKPG